MSETAPESPPRSSSNTFTRQVGPLPLWAWMGIGLALALVYYFWKQHTSSNANASQTASDTTAAGGADSSLVPQFVNQTYVSGVPPQPGQPGPSGPPGPTGPTGSTGATGTTAPAAQAKQYPAPTGETVSKLSGTSAKVMWNYITSVTPKPTSYTIAVYQLNGKLAQQFTVNAPDTASGQAVATVAGLHSGWQYNVRVWANGGKVAPTHSTAKLSL